MDREKTREKEKYLKESKHFIRYLLDKPYCLGRESEKLRDNKIERKRERERERERESRRVKERR